MTARDSPGRRCRCRQMSEADDLTLFCLQVVAEQKILIAQIESAACDDGVWPAIVAAALRLVHAAGQFESQWSGLDKAHGAWAVFLPEIEMTVGVCDGTFAQQALFLPDDFS